MVNSPEDYFNKLDFSPNSSQEEYTPAERLFMQKYLGLSGDDLLGKKAKPVAEPPAAPAAPAPEETPADSMVGYIDELSFEPDQMEDAEQQPAGPAFIEKAVETEPVTKAEEAAAVEAEVPLPEVEAEKAPADMSEEISEATPAAQPEPAPLQAAAPVEPEPAKAAPPPPAPEPEPAPAPVQTAVPAPAPAPSPATPAPDRAPRSVLDVTREEFEAFKAAEPPLENILKQEEFCQMVAFFIGDQEFVIPTMAMQEVIRFEVPIKIPMAPPFVEGVISLRGRVTPVVNLRDMLAVNNKPLESNNKCIIICLRRGIQLGFVVEKIHTMYRVPQIDLEWGVEAQLGINSDVDFISAVMKSEDGNMLMGMLSVDKIIDFILR